MGKVIGDVLTAREVKDLYDIGADFRPENRATRELWKRSATDNIETYIEGFEKSIKHQVDVKREEVRSLQQSVNRLNKESETLETILNKVKEKFELKKK